MAAAAAGVIADARKPSQSLVLRGVRGLVSKKKKRFQDDEFDLDLAYVVENRIIAMGFPSSGKDALYRNPIEEVVEFFANRHPGHYKIYNLCSEREYETQVFAGPVARFPFDDHNPCPLELIGRFCEDVDGWLGAHAENVIAVHCKAGKGRTGLMVACYLMHSRLANDAEEALTMFSRNRTKDGKGVTIPSQIRYVHYYGWILTHGLPPVRSLYIVHVRLCGVPNMDRGSCTPYLVVVTDNLAVYDMRKDEDKHCKVFQDDFAVEIYFRAVAPSVASSGVHDGPLSGRNDGGDAMGPVHEQLRRSVYGDEGGVPAVALTASAPPAPPAGGTMVRSYSTGDASSEAARDNLTRSASSGDAMFGAAHSLFLAASAGSPPAVVRRPSALMAALSDGVPAAGGRGASASHAPAADGVPAAGGRGASAARAPAAAAVPVLARIDGTGTAVSGDVVAGTRVPLEVTAPIPAPTLEAAAEPTVSGSAAHSRVSAVAPAAERAAAPPAVGTSGPAAVVAVTELERVVDTATTAGWGTSTATPAVGAAGVTATVATAVAIEPTGPRQAPRSPVTVPDVTAVGAPATGGDGGNDERSGTTGAVSGAATVGSVSESTRQAAAPPGGEAAGAAGGDLAHGSAAAAGPPARALAQVAAVDSTIDAGDVAMSRDAAARSAAATGVAQTTAVAAAAVRVAVAPPPLTLPPIEVPRASGAPAGAPAADPEGVHGRASFGRGGSVRSGGEREVPAWRVGAATTAPPRGFTHAPAAVGGGTSVAPPAVVSSSGSALELGVLGTSMRSVGSDSGSSAGAGAAVEISVEERQRAIAAELATRQVTRMVADPRLELAAAAGGGGISGGGGGGLVAARQRALREKMDTDAGAAGPKREPAAAPAARGTVRSGLRPSVPAVVPAARPPGAS